MAFRGQRITHQWVDEVIGFADSADSDVPVVRGMIDDLQLVEVDHKYGYAWDGTPLLQIGDFVMCPGGDERREWMGIVTDYGSTYTGFHSKIKRIAAARDLERHGPVFMAKLKKKTGD